MCSRSRIIIIIVLLRWYCYQSLSTTRRRYQVVLSSLAPNRGSLLLNSIIIFSEGWLVPAVVHAMVHLFRNECCNNYAIPFTAGTHEKSPAHLMRCFLTLSKPWFEAARNMGSDYLRKNQLLLFRRKHLRPPANVRSPSRNYFWLLCCNTLVHCKSCVDTIEFLWKRHETVGVVFWAIGSVVHRTAV